MYMEGVDYPGYMYTDSGTAYEQQFSFWLYESGQNMKMLITESASELHFCSSPRSYVVITYD